MTFKNISWLLGYIMVVAALVALSALVLQQEPFAFDTAVLQTVHRLSSDRLDAVMATATQLGQSGWTVPFAGAVIIALWLGQHRTEALVFIINCLGGIALSVSLKLFFAKARPTLWTSPISENTFSFPSGHAISAVVLYGFVAYLLALQSPGYRWVFYVGAIALSLLIGFSRLYLGVHWPTDVIGGYLIGFLWVRLCIGLLYKIRGY